MDLQLIHAVLREASGLVGTIRSGVTYSADSPALGALWLRLLSAGDLVEHELHPDGLPAEPSASDLAQLGAAMDTATVVYCHPSILEGVQEMLMGPDGAGSPASPGLTGPECFIGDPHMHPNEIELRATRRGVEA